MKGSPAFAAAIGLFLFAANSSRAHDPFQTTVISTMQHGRLEVVVLMATEMGGELVKDPSDPEAPALGVDTLERYRGLLEKRAAGLYEVSDGKKVLPLERVVISLSEAGHLKIVLFYPQPTAWPLSFRALPQQNVPTAYTAELEVLDDGDRLLGGKRLTPQNPANAELSVAPSPSPTPSPMATPTRPPTLEATSVWTPDTIFVLAGAVILAVMTTLLVLWALKKSPRS